MGRDGGRGWSGGGVGGEGDGVGGKGGGGAGCGGRVGAGQGSRLHQDEWYSLPASLSSQPQPRPGRGGTPLPDRRPEALSWVHGSPAQTAPASLLEQSPESSPAPPASAALGEKGASRPPPGLWVAARSCPRGPPREPPIGIAAAAPWLEGGRWDVPKGQGPEHTLAGGREGRVRGPPQLQRRSVPTGPPLETPHRPSGGLTLHAALGSAFLRGQENCRRGERSSEPVLKRRSRVEESPASSSGMLWQPLPHSAPWPLGPAAAGDPGGGGAGGAHRVSRSTQAQRHPRATGPSRAGRAERRADAADVPARWQE